MPQPDIEVVFEGKFIRTCLRGRWEYVERTTPGGAVIILALTPEGKVLFTEQFRIPVKQSVIEFPAGLVGDEPDAENEHFCDAARRELEEETGWRPGRVEPVISGPTSAGLTAEWVHLVRASDLQRVGEGGGTEDEDIVVHEVPLADAEAWLSEKRAQGVAVDAKVYSGLWFLRDG